MIGVSFGGRMVCAGESFVSEMRCVGSDGGGVGVDGVARCSSASSIHCFA